MSIFRIVVWLVCSGVGVTCAADGRDENLPPVTIINMQDFRLDGSIARQRRVPILILFSMDGCDYCEYVEEEHLKPMLRNAGYRSKVIIRRVMTDSPADIIDVDGLPISSDNFSHRYQAYLTPTVVFFDYNGRALARIIGVRNTEFYGGELDRGLEDSLKIMRQL